MDNETILNNRWEYTNNTYFNDDEQYDGEREADLNTKIKAIDTLNKMDNSYQQNINIKGSLENPYANLSEEELRKLAGE